MSLFSQFANFPKLLAAAKQEIADAEAAAALVAKYANHQGIMDLISQDPNGQAEFQAFAALAAKAVPDTTELVAAVASVV